MDLKVLRYFLAVVQKESITAAAEYLYLTQPTLSRQLSALEDELGVTLFMRGNRKITLTEEGRRLRKRAEEILDLVTKTESEFLAPAEQLRGDIHIGSGETRAMSDIVQIIQQVRVDYPDIHVHIHSGDANDILDSLTKGLVDFAVLIGPEDLSEYEFLRLKKKNQWGLLMRKDSPYAAKTVITQQDMLLMPLIFPRQHNTENKISQWMGPHYRQLNIISTYNLIFNAALMVEHDLGYALCLDGLVSTVDESIFCYKPLQPRLDIDVYVVWKKHNPLSKVSELFANQLKLQLL
ncbi:LysR family transcriptional regulator [Celerinatantimonas sp. YJH-8]|uniref:LysR family transcriptional regulator n=1 Tax=Celerinatantimonas sp. YJH-8 TaxID=3228714 RepID=UPI0038C150EE